MLPHLSNLNIEIFRDVLPGRAFEIETELANESNELEGVGMKIFISTNIIDMYTNLEVLLGLKLYRNTDTLTEASNPIDELDKRGEIQTKQQY